MRRTSDPEGLDDLHWKGEASYRVLSYYFIVRWTWREAGAYIQRVLRPFNVPRDPAEEREPPTPGLPPRYSIVATGQGSERRYQLLYAGRMMISSRVRSAPLQTFFWHVNAETIRRTGDFLLIHAGAVATRAGDGLVILGESGSGKTTLTAALVQAGFGYLSDEAAAIDPVTHRLYPYPKALTLKAGGLKPFREFVKDDGADLLQDQHHILPEDIRAGSISGPCDVRYVIAHRYREGAVTTLSRITSAAGLVELGRNGLNLSVYKDRALTLLGEVARGASHCTLVSGDLSEAVAEVVRFTGSGACP